jgi:hypothetical protein
MCNAEGVPQHDVCVVNGCVFISYPFRNSTRWLAGCLGDVASGGIDLLVVI